jgi:hypothetical protein
MQREDVLKNLIKMVAEERLGLHDDRENLVPKQNLVEIIRTNNRLSEKEIDSLFRKKLLLPVEDEISNQLYHASISIDFLNLLEKLDRTGFSVRLQQKIAAMYYPLYWDLCTDIEYEISKFKREEGRDPSMIELAYLRVINEFAVVNTMEDIEKSILKLEPAGDRELQQLIQEARQKKKALKKKASFGYQENQIREIIKEIWQNPFSYFQGREIKAFININSIEWTEEENRLLWGGHFDFALCDRDYVLQLVIEYNGKGHYGKSDEERIKVQSRDATKKRICEKAGIPLIMLTSEFALLEDHQEILKTFLSVFRNLERNEAIHLQFLYKRMSELLRRLISGQIKTTELDSKKLALKLLSRLDTYKSQERGDMLLALLWQVCTTFGGLNELSDILNTIKK